MTQPARVSRTEESRHPKRRKTTSADGPQSVGVGSGLGLSSVEQLLALQRTAGNALVSRLLARRNLIQPSAANPSRAARTDSPSEALVGPDGPPVLQRDSTDVHAELVGHASPRWEYTHGGTSAELNLRLSEDRVESVRVFIEEMLGNALRERGLDAEFTYESRNVEEPAPPGAQDTASLSASAVGSTETDGGAGGDARANRPEMRRVDLTVTVTWQVTGAALSSESEAVTISERCEPNASDQWAIKLEITGGGGHAGLGVAAAYGPLKNLRTGQTVHGSFQGGGVGVGLSSPGVDPGWGDFEEFTTDSAVTFDDFDGTLARLSTAGAGIAIIGYGVAYISFPNMGANHISVGGFNMGQIGADAGANVGTWNVIGTPPGPICTPEETAHYGVVHSEAYTTAMPNEFRHHVLFETGSAHISYEELVDLQSFVDQVMANYEYTGVQESRMADE